MASRVHNPWDAAAACEAHAQSTKDLKLRDKFRKLRDSWIRIANDEQLVGGAQRAFTIDPGSDGAAKATSAPHLPEATIRPGRAFPGRRQFDENAS
jgi:hypothetical protein